MVLSCRAEPANNITDVIPAPLLPTLNKSIQFVEQVTLYGSREVGTLSDFNSIYFIESFKVGLNKFQRLSGSVLENRKANFNCGTNLNLTTLRLINKS